MKCFKQKGIFSPDEKVIRESTQRTVFGLVRGYNYFNWRNLFIQKLLNVKNARIYILGEYSNIGYFEFLRHLIKIKFVDSYGLLSTYYDYPKLFTFKVRYYVGDKKNGHKLFSNSSGMVRLIDGQEICYSKAIGEALERRSARYNSEDQKYYPRVTHAHPAFSYEMIPQFSAQQKKIFSDYARSEEDLNQMPCVKVKNVTKGIKSYIPLQCIFFGKKLEHNEKLLCQSTTNGCGGGFTYEDAALSAVYELIERDNFLLWWFSGLAPKKVEIDRSTDFAVEVIAATQKFGLEVFFLDTSYDLNLNSCVCVIIDPVLNIIGMGGKAGLGDEIYAKAYTEALMLITSCRKRIDNGFQPKGFPRDCNFTDASIGQKERETQCCEPEAIAYIRENFLAGGSLSHDGARQKSRAFSSARLELDFVTSEFLRLSERYGDGYNLYLHQFKSTLLTECNYVVVRAFVPSFLKLHLTESFATPISARLKKFMEDHDKDYSVDVINTVPHFFP